MPGMTLMDFPQAMHQCPHADLMNLASVYILRQQFYPKLKQNILFRTKVQLNKHIIVLTKYATNKILCNFLYADNLVI